MADFFSKETIKSLRKLRQLKPDMFKSFIDFGPDRLQGRRAAQRQDEAIDGDNRGARHPVPVVYRREHQARVEHGATDEEIAEAVFVAMAMRAGAAFSHHRDRASDAANAAANEPQPLIRVDRGAWSRQQRIARPGGSISAESKWAAAPRWWCNRCAPPARWTSTQPSRRAINWRAPARELCGSPSTMKKRWPRSRRSAPRRAGIVLSVDLQENYRSPVRSHRTSTRSATTPAISIISKRPRRFRTRCDGWSISRATTTSRSGSGSIAVRWRRPFWTSTPTTSSSAIVESTAYHCDLMDEYGFRPLRGLAQGFRPGQGGRGQPPLRARRPDVPLHLGVTEAGLPPDGIIKTRLAFEKLLAQAIGETIRVSLTLPNDRKHEEVDVGHRIIEDVEAGRFISVPDLRQGHEHHLMPVVLAGGERELRRAGAAGQGADRLRGAVSNHDRGDGLPGKRAGRDRRRRPGPMVRSDHGESQEEGSQDRQFPATTMY